MFSPLIHSTTNYAKRKPIPRLFPEKRYLENMYDNFALRMGSDGERVTNDNRFDGDHVEAQAAFDKLGTFAERNAKPERKHDSLPPEVLEGESLDTYMLRIIGSDIALPPETVPQANEGWIEHCDPSDGGVGMWMKGNFCIFHYPSTKNWEHSGSNNRYASWLELKRALEEKK